MTWLRSNGRDTNRPEEPEGLLVPREKAEPWVLLLSLPSVLQKQLGLLVPNQSERLKDNGEIFLNACLETTVSTA